MRSKWFDLIMIQKQVNLAVCMRPLVFLLYEGSPEEVLFNYGFYKEKSKILYSHYKRKIPNSFSGTVTEL